jgi:hypothetical protein
MFHGGGVLVEVGTISIPNDHITKKLLVRFIIIFFIYLIFCILFVCICIHRGYIRAYHQSLADRERHMLLSSTHTASISDSWCIWQANSLYIFQFLSNITPIYL